ncbi:MAG: M50 family metallopeptidase [Planctomycetes bacterium]|nr:M50 family metallopeptidase [Planctomycetota bacterium]
MFDGLETISLTRAATPRAFVRDHLRLWPYFLPAFLLVTLGHELAHAGAAWCCGGTVQSLVFWPTGNGTWGYVQYRLPSGRAWADPLVTLAPHAVWLIAALGTHAWLRSRSYRAVQAKGIFLLGFALPIGDVLYALFPYLAGRSNDLSAAFGPPDPARALVGSIALAGLVVWAFLLHRRVYGPDALAPRSFLVLMVTLLLVTWGERVLS